MEPCRQRSRALGDPRRNVGSSVPVLRSRDIICRPASPRVRTLRHAELASLRRLNAAAGRYRSCDRNHPSLVGSCGCSWADDHDAAWTREKEFSAESYYHPLVNPYSTNSIEDELSIESQMSGPAPKWAANARPVGIDFYRPNPLPRSQDVWGENDAIMKYVNSVVASAITAPKLPDLTPEELQDSQTLPEDY